MALSVELNPNMQVVERVNYTFLDALADVGGLGEVLAFSFSFFLAIINYNHTQNFVASQLYTYN